MQVDVVLAAGREQLHAGGLRRDSPPGEQARGGALLVLCAWGIEAPLAAAALMLVATVAALAGAGRSLRGAAADGH